MQRECMQEHKIKIKAALGKGNFKDELKVKYTTLSFIRICKSGIVTH